MGSLGGLTGDVLIAALRRFRETNWLRPGAQSTPFPALATPQLLMVALFTILLAIVLATYSRYGFTTDEFRGFRRAQRIFEFFASGGTSDSLSDIDMFHGAAPDVLALALQTLIPPLSYDSRHLVSALFGVAGIYYTYRFGSKFGGEWIGVFAALFLAVTPLWFGHMFLNHKDIPFATLLLASTYYCLLALTGHRTSPLFWVKTGLAIGLLASTKIGGLPILTLVVTVFIACLMYLPNQDKREIPIDFARRLFATLLAGLFGCLIGFLFFWPQVYANLGEAIFAGAQTNPEIFHGSHSIIRFAITIPLYLLVLGGIGIGWAVYRRDAFVIACLLVFYSVLVAGEAIQLKGGRHLLFLYPFFMISAAYPVHLILNLIKGSFARSALFGVIGLCVAGTGFEMYKLFPYQYSFYNSLVGGFTGADGHKKIDQWGAAEREALEQIAATTKSSRVVRVYSCGSKLNVMNQPGFEAAPSQEEADYIIALRGRTSPTTGCSPDMFEGLPVIGEVRREGMLLARIYTPR